MRTARANLSLTLGLTMLLLLAGVMLLPFFVPMDAMTVHMQAWVGEKMRPAPFAPGVPGYSLGSDQVGRDLLARLIYGARYTVLIALGIAFIRAMLAIPLGLAAGWYGGRLARFTNMFSTSFSALPTLVLVVFILEGVTTFRTGSNWVWFYAGVVTLVGVPRLAEQVRRLTRGEKKALYVESAIAMGAPVRRILFRHILPVIRGNLMVSMAAETAWVLMLMGQLAIFGIYIGDSVTVQLDGFPPIIVERAPEWAAMLGVNRGVVRTSPWIALYPAVALGLTVASLQLLAEGVRQRWLHR